MYLEYIALNKHMCLWIYVNEQMIGPVPQEINKAGKKCLCVFNRISNKAPLPDQSSIIPAHNQIHGKL